MVYLLVFHPQRTVFCLHEVLKYHGAPGRFVADVDIVYVTFEEGLVPDFFHRFGEFHGFQSTFVSATIFFQCGYTVGEDERFHIIGTHEGLLANGGDIAEGGVAAHVDDLLITLPFE